MTYTLPKPTYENLCRGGGENPLSDENVVLMDRMISAILRPVFAVGMPLDSLTTEGRSIVIGRICEKCNEYAEFLRVMSNFPYCATLLLENTIQVLQKHHHAPKDLLDRLQECV